MNRGALLLLLLGGIALGLCVAKNCAALTSGYAADYDYAIAFFIAVTLYMLGLPLLIYWRTRWVGAGLIAAGILSLATFYVGMVVLLKEDGVAWRHGQMASLGLDRREVVYPSFADADKDGATTRGWIPDYLPESSRAIHSLQEDSPSREWCSFEFLSQDSRGLRKNLKSVDTLPPPVKRVPSPRVSWWPAVLKGSLDAEKIRRAGFDLYVVERPATSVTTEIFLFAIDWSKGHGFFYSTSESGSVPSSPPD